MSDFWHDLCFPYLHGQYHFYSATNHLAAVSVLSSVVQRTSAAKHISLDRSAADQHRQAQRPAQRRHLYVISRLQCKLALLTLCLAFREPHCAVWKGWAH